MPLTGLMLLGLAHSVHAACSDPEGRAGAILYNADHNIAQLCNGTQWLAWGSGASDQYWEAAGSNITYSGGHVGIGTPSPGSKLHVSGTITASQVSMGWTRIICSSGTCPHSSGTAYLDCPAGKKVIGGGCDCTSQASWGLRGSFPRNDTSWGCVCGQSGAGQALAQVYAICANIN